MRNLSFDNYKNRNEEYIFMPGHPDADKRGYVNTSNLKFINELIEMINSEHDSSDSDEINTVQTKLNFPGTIQ
jgi:flagellar basal body rod protein FlgC